MDKQWEQMTEQQKIEFAAREYVARKRRQEHPIGSLDSGGRWYPSADEKCWFCAAIRAPSKNWPHSLMLQCRTIDHVAFKYGLDPLDIRRVVRAIPPHPALLCARALPALRRSLPQEIWCRPFGDPLLQCVRAPLKGGLTSRH